MPAEDLDLRRDYFVTLREEIKETKARIFRLVLIALVGVPIMAYFVVSGASHLLIVLAPLAVLLLLVVYLAEHTMLMRAASYIRQQVETGDEEWQRWISSRGSHAAERQLFAMFVVIGLFVYALLVKIAIEELMKLPVQPTARWQRIVSERNGVMLMYGVATLWALVTLIRFWRSAVTTD